MSYVGRNFNLNSVVSFPVSVSVGLHDVVGFNDVLEDELIEQSGDGFDSSLNDVVLVCSLYLLYHCFFFADIKTNNLCRIIFELLLIVY